MIFSLPVKNTFASSLYYRFLHSGFSCIQQCHSNKHLKFQSSFFSKLGVTAIALTLGLSCNSISPDELNFNNIPHTLYQSLFHSKTEAFLYLINVAEGVSNKFYLDNIGIATAYGWNPTRNTTVFNTQVSKAMGLNSSEIKSIQSISNDFNSFINVNNKNTKLQQVQFIPKQLKNTVLTQKQINNNALFMLQFYEKEFIKTLEIKAKERHYDFSKALTFYNSMPSNQQVVMIHMVYKLGLSGLLKYNNFFDHLFNYFEQPTNVNFKKISSNFEYTYKSRDGQTINDDKVVKIHNVFFNYCGEDLNSSPLIKKQIKSNNEICQKLVGTKNTIKNSLFS